MSLYYGPGWINPRRETMNRFTLTAEQQKAYDFVASRARAGEITPSYDEIRAHLGLRSKSGVHRIMKGLVARGWIEQLPGRARAVRLIGELPADSNFCPHCGAPQEART